MAELERSELGRLTQLAKGDYTTEERMMLDVRVYRGEKLLSQDLALNDAVFSKGSIARVAEMEVFADQVVIRQLMGGRCHRGYPPPALPPTPCLPEAPLWSPRPNV